VDSATSESAISAALGALAAAAFEGLGGGMDSPQASAKSAKRAALLFIMEGQVYYTLVIGTDSEDVRAAIESGALRGPALLELLLSVPFRNRDAWLDEVLGFEPSPSDVPDLPREAVPYLPCGVDEILAMLREVAVTEEHELVDLGSGLGRVVILTRLIAGARAKGIEIQEPLVRRARERAMALGADVSFVHANVADIELDGSLFFLYAPCNGQMLTAFLRRLEEVARRRPIVVCTVGLEFREVSWLVPRKVECVSLAVYDSSFTRSA
jgi:hypothetical protein